MTTQEVQEFIERFDKACHVTTCVTFQALKDGALYEVHYIYGLERQFRVTKDGSSKIIYEVPEGLNWSISFPIETKLTEHLDRVKAEITRLEIMYQDGLAICEELGIHYEGEKE